MVERTKEQREEDYIIFKGIVDLLVDYFECSEEFAVNVLQKSIEQGKYVIKSKNPAFETAIPKEKGEIIKWCCMRYNTAKRKALRDEKKQS